jgi:hypothetical protein
MENKKTTKQYIIPFGILFGAIMILELVLGYALNIDPATNGTYGIVINLLNYLFLPFIIIFLGCNYFKKNVNNGFISFFESIKIGMTISVVAATISGVFSAIFFYFVPEYVENLMRNAKGVMLKKNPEMTADQIEMGISMMKKFMNPFISIPTTIIIFAFIGLIYSMIVGAIVKKESLQSL